MTQKEAPWPSAKRAAFALGVAGAALGAFGLAAAATGAAAHPAARFGSLLESAGLVAVGAALAFHGAGRHAVGRALGAAAMVAAAALAGAEVAQLHDAQVPGGEHASGTDPASWRWIGSGLALALQGGALASWGRVPRIGEAAVLAALLLAFARAAAHLLGAAPPSPSEAAAAAGVVVASLGLLVGRPGGWWGEALRGTGPEALLARRLLPAVAAIPLAAAYIRLRAQALGYITLQEGALLLVTVTTGLLVAVGGVGIRVVQRAHAARLQAEAQARGRERERLAFFERSLELLAVVGLDRRFRIVNPAWSEVLGWPAASLVGTDFLDLVHPADRGRTELEAARLAQGGSNTPFENRYRCQDGSYRWLRWASTVDDENGVFLAAAHDVTAERAARSMQDLLAAIIQGSSEAIITRDLQGLVTSWNPAAERIFGYTRAEAIGMPVAQLMPPEGRGEEARFEAEVRAGRAVEGVETVRVGRDGHRFDAFLTFTPVYDAGGEITGFAKSVRDITERRRAEAAAKAAQERFARVFHSSPVAFSLTREDGRIVDANDAYCALTGYPRAELLQDGFSAAQVWADPSERDRMLVAIRSRGLLRDLEVHIRRKDGSERVALAAVEFLDVGGNTTLLSILQDITERRRHQREREARIATEAELERLRRMDAFRTEFLNSTAHELATPLTPILLQLHRLESGPRPEQQAAAVAVLRRNIERLRRIVADLLAAADVQARALRLDLQDVDLGALARTAVLQSRPDAAASGVQVDVQGGEGVLVRADPARVLLALGHLLGNAIKFSARGTAVVARVETGAEFAKVVVKDEGAGMEPQDIGRLWNPYVQVHDKMQFTQSGSGLGLYVTRGIVQLHGGTVGASSQGRGTGSTFWFTLPRSGSAAAEAASEAHGQGQGAAKPRRPFAIADAKADAPLGT